MTSEAPRDDQGAHVEELLRINAELATEIRNLTKGRAAAPRSGVGTSARGISRLIAERDSLRSERDSLAAELEANRAELDRLGQHSAELSRQVHDQARHIGELSHEVQRLRGGGTGLLRRVRARLLRR